MKGDYNMKPTFAKLGLKMNNLIKTVIINEQEIEIKQYLPVNEKLRLIGDVIAQAADENNFSNPIKLEVFTKLEIVFTYTNLSFTEKQKEDLVKLYDILESNGVFSQILSAMNETELKFICDGVEKCSNAIYTYRNSVMGIIDSISGEYGALSLNASEIQEKLADENNLALLRNILTKLG